MKIPINLDILKNGEKNWNTLQNPQPHHNLTYDNYFITEYYDEILKLYSKRTYPTGFEYSETKIPPTVYIIFRYDIIPKMRFRRAL